MRARMEDRRALVRNHARAYQRVGKKQRGEILDVFVEATGYSRVYAARLLRGHGRCVRVRGDLVVRGDIGKRGLGGRPREYGPDVLEALKELHRHLDYACGKRLKPGIAGALESLERHGELEVSAQVRDQLLKISAATIDRLLSVERKKWLLKNPGGTKPGTLLKSQIPVRTFADWDEGRPGFVEIDLVEHNGGSTRGDYAQTLDVTDVCSGWTEPLAVLNKAQRWVFGGLMEVRERLPFTLLGIDSDNGGEFINQALRRYCQEQKITFTRARPNRKNDNCYVEQKNYSIVRRAAGHGRFVGPEAVRTLNQLYAAVRLRSNFFLPSMKLIEKQRHGSRVTKRHDEARTPCQRLLESPEVSEETKENLRRQFQELNLAQLNRDISRAQRGLEKLTRRGRTGPAPLRVAPDSPAKRGSPFPASASAAGTE